MESFEKLQLKKMELEFSVDPLFKKASADFDEGGAKGLLLNHLSIDNTGRIVFDSSDDTQDVTDGSRRDSMLQEGEEKDSEEEQPMSGNGPIDIASLGARFFPDLSKLDSQDICPSLKTFQLGDGSGSLDLPFLRAPEDWRKEAEKENDDIDDARSGIVLNDDDNAFGDDIGGFDLPPETGFGEGGEAWAREAHIEPQIRPHNIDADAEGGAEGEGEVGGFDANGNANAYGVTLQHRPGASSEAENILSYFDNALAKNWAGPEHWKIKKIKDAAKPAPATKRKEKEPFEIDFMAPMSRTLCDALGTMAVSNAAISLPKKDWKSKTRNLLPDDKHFNSRDLLRLFLKPKARMGSRKQGRKEANGRQNRPVPEGEVDEAYWAQNSAAPDAQPSEDEPRGDYDANFFADDPLSMGGGVDDSVEDFADAREALTPSVEGEGNPTAGIDGTIAGSQAETREGAWGTQLVTQSRRLRPEYVQYARVAKKVDVRRLKEEMWRGIGLEVRVSHLLKNLPAKEVIG